MHYKIYQDTARQWRWRLIAANGRIIADSAESYRDLRRTCASWMSMHQENLITIKDILHHASVSTTQIYARTDHASLRAALTRHGERVI